MMTYLLVLFLGDAPMIPCAATLALQETALNTKKAEEGDYRVCMYNTVRSTLLHMYVCNTQRMIRLKTPKLSLCRPFLSQRNFKH